MIFESFGVLLFRIQFRQVASQSSFAASLPALDIHQSLNLSASSRMAASSHPCPKAHSPYSFGRFQFSGSRVPFFGDTLVSLFTTGFGSGFGWHSRGIPNASELPLFSLGFLSDFDQRWFAFSDCFLEYFCEFCVSWSARRLRMASLSMVIFPTSTSAFSTFLALPLVQPNRRARRS